MMLLSLLLLLGTMGSDAEDQREVDMVDKEEGAAEGKGPAEVDMVDKEEGAAEGDDDSGKKRAKNYRKRNAEDENGGGDGEVPEDVKHEVRLGGKVALVCSVWEVFVCVFMCVYVYS